MFENLIAELLNRLLGSYVSPVSFQADRVSTSVYKGHVLLSKLELRADALDRLLLPITLKKGLIMKAEISIPWTQLGLKPVEISLEGVYLLLNPKFEWSADELERRAQASKAARLVQAELVKRSQEAMLGLGKLVDGSSPDASFTSRLISRITDNIEIRLKNVHIRFEDSNTFCFGATLESLSIRTTDSSWVPRFKDLADPQTHKLCEIQRFSIYGDPPSATTATFSLFSEGEDVFIKFFSESIPHLINSNSHTYILKPMDGRIKITFFRETPTTKLDFFCQSVDIRLETFQFTSFLKLANHFIADSDHSIVTVGLKRPTSSPMQNAAAWWSYAIQMVLKQVKDKRYKWSRAYFTKRRRERLEYTLLWKRNVVGGFAEENRNYAPLSSQDKIRMEWLEKCLDFSDIMLFRSYAENELRLEKAHQELWELGFAKGANTSAVMPSSSSAAVASGWIMWTLGMSSSSSSNSSLKESLSQQDVERFLALLRHNPAATVLENKEKETESLIGAVWTFKIPKGSIFLTPIRLSFNTVELEYKKRMNGSSIVLMTLESFGIYDGFHKVLGPRGNYLAKRNRSKSATTDDLDLAAASNSNSFKRSLVSLDLAESKSKDLKERQKSRIFTLQVDSRPSQEVDLLFTLSVAPLEIIYSESFADKLSELSLALPRSANYPSNNQKRSAISVQIELKSSLFIIPSNETSEVLVVDLGTFTCQDQSLRTKSQISAAMESRNLQDDRFFDEYLIKVGKIGVWISKHGKRSTLINRFGFRGCLFKIVQRDLYGIPRFRLNLEFAEVIHVRLSADVLAFLTKILSSPRRTQEIVKSWKKSVFITTVNSNDINQVEEGMWSEKDEPVSLNTENNENDASSEFFSVLGDDWDGGESYMSKREEESSEARRIRKKLSFAEEDDLQSFYTVDSSFRKSKSVRRGSFQKKDEVTLKASVKFAGIALHYGTKVEAVSFTSPKSSIQRSSTLQNGHFSQESLPLHVRSWFDELRRLDETDSPSKTYQPSATENSSNTSVSSEEEQEEDLKCASSISLTIDQINLDMEQTNRSRLDLSIGRAYIAFDEEDIFSRFLFHSALTLSPGQKLTFAASDEEGFFMQTHAEFERNILTEVSCKVNSSVDIILNKYILETKVIPAYLEISNLIKPSEVPDNSSQIQKIFIFVNDFRLWLVDDNGPFALLETIGFDCIVEQTKGKISVCGRIFDHSALNLDGNIAFFKRKAEAQDDLPPFFTFNIIHYLPTVERSCKTVSKVHEDVVDEVLDSILGEVETIEVVKVFLQGTQISLISNPFFAKLEERMMQRLLKFSLITGAMAKNIASGTKSIVSMHVNVFNSVIEIGNHVRIGFSRMQNNNQHVMTDKEENFVCKTDTRFSDLYLEVSNHRLFEDNQLRCRQIGNNKIRFSFSDLDVKLLQDDLNLLAQTAESLLGVSLSIPSSGYESATSLIVWEFSKVTINLISGVLKKEQKSALIARNPVAKGGFAPATQVIAVITFNNLEFQIIDDVHLALSLGSFHVREGKSTLRKNQYLQLISFPEASHLTIDLDRRSLVPKHIGINLNRSRCLFIPETFRAIFGFFVGTAPSKSPKPNSSAITSTCSIEANCQQSEIWIIGGEFTDALVFGITEISTFWMSRSDFNVSLLGCYSSILKHAQIPLDDPVATFSPIIEEEQETRRILLPFDFKISLRENLYDLHCSSLKLQLSIMDVSAVGKILSGLSISNAQAAVPRSQDIREPPTITAVAVKFEIDSVDLVCLNERNQPLIRFLITLCRLEPSLPLFLGRLTVRAEHRFRKDWEVLLEEITLTTSIENNRIQIFCDDEINVNVVQTLLTTVEADDEDLQFIKVDNQTGLNLRQIEDDEGAFSPGDSLSFVVEDVNGKQWKLSHLLCPKHGKVARTSVDSKEFAIVVETDTQSLILKSPLAIKNESAHPLEIFIPDELDPPSRSTTPDSESVMSSTFKRRIRRNQHRLSWSCHLPPNESIYVPADMAQVLLSGRFPMLLRPNAQVSGAPDYSFAELRLSSSPQLNTRTLKKSISFADFGSFSSTGSGRDSWSCHYVVETKWSDPYSQCLILSAPVILTNNLNSSATYRLLSDESKAEGQLPVGAELKWHGAQVSSKSLTLSLKIEGFEWSDLVSIDDGQVILKDDSDRKLNIDLQMNKTKSGRVELCLSVPFWIINNTQLPLLLASSSLDPLGGRVAAGQTKTIRTMRRIRLMHQLQEKFRRKRAITLAPMGLLEILDEEVTTTTSIMFSSNHMKLRFWDSRWSDTCFFDHANEQVIESKQEWRVRDPAVSRALYALTAKITDSGFGKTKIISLNPRFMLLNGLGRSLKVRQWRGNLGELSRGGSAPLSSTPTFSAGRESKSHKDPFASTRGNGIVTIGPGEKVPFHWRDKSGPKQLSACFDEFGWEWGSGVQIEDCIGEFCSRLRNRHTQHVYILRIDIQMVDSTILVTFRPELSGLPPYRIDNLSLQTIKFHQEGSPTVETLLPYHSCAYTWDLDSKKKTLIVETLPQSDEIGDRLYSLFLPNPVGTFRLLNPSTWFRKNAGSKLLGIYSLDRNFGLLSSSIPHFNVSLEADGPTRVLTISDARVPSAVPPNSKDSSKFGVLLSFKGIGISIIEDEGSQRREILRVCIKNVNSIYSHDGVEKIIKTSIGDLQIDNQLMKATYPVLLSSKSEPNTNFLDVSLVKSNRFAGLDFLKSFSIRLSPIQLNLEADIIQSTLRFVSNIPTSPSSSVPQKLKSYVEELKVHPILVTVNFKGALSLLGETQWFGAHVEGAKLYLREFKITHSLLTASDPIPSRIFLHYMQAIRRHWYVLASSVDLLGDPVGLGKTIWTGTVESISEISTGTFSGVGKGVWILFQSLVVGSTSSILNICNGASAALYFVTSGFPVPKSFFEGLAQGFAGIVVLPYVGYEKHGPRGLFRGLFKGFFGVIARPLAGALSVVARLVDSIRGAVDPSSKIKVVRSRTPRIFKHCQKIGVFEPDRAYGEEALWSVGLDKLTWVSHKAASEKHLVVLTETFLVLLVNSQNHAKQEIVGLLFSVSRKDFVLSMAENSIVYLYCLSPTRFCFEVKALSCKNVQTANEMVKFLNNWRIEFYQM